MVEESRKRASDDGEGDVERKRFNYGNEPLLKVLVPNVIAGVLIGKGGSFLNEMKSKYDGCIRLSGNKEFYPGTEERVVVITGKLPEIVAINNCIMEKTQEFTSKIPLHDGRADIIKIVVTNLTAGMLIGKGGASIKAIQEECHVKISISDKQHSTVEGEQVLTMTGSLEERSEGCKQVIEKIAEEPGNMQNTKVKYTAMGLLSDHRTRQNENYGLPSGHLSHVPRQPWEQDGNNLSNRRGQRDNNYSLPGQTTSMFDNREHRNQLYRMQGEKRMAHEHVAINRRPIDLKSKAEVKLEVPSIMVGLLMGKQGQTVKDLVHRSGGARFAFSNKDDVVEGTTNRTLTITGNMEQVHSAYNLVLVKAEEFQFTDQ